MGEKRFKFVKSLDNDNCFIKDTVDNQIYMNEEIADLLNYLNERFKLFSDELYCKDRKLEEMGVPIECCDKKMSEQRYRLEENNQTNELLLWGDAEIFSLFKSNYDNRKHLSIIVDRLNEQQVIINKLKEENERLKNKLNTTALELVDETISMGKAVEISEMDYQEFLEYRRKRRKPMELQI